MPNLNREFDTYGHPNDWQAGINSGFTAASSGTAAGTVVNPGTADPTGTTNVTNPYGAGDAEGMFQITTAGTQTTGALRTIYFQNPFPYVPGAPFATVSTMAGAAAGGTITVTATATSLAISVGTALTAATSYIVRYGHSG